MKSITRLMAAVAVVMLVFASCVSNKEMTYLQGVDQMYSTPQSIDKDFGLVIQPDDELAISITSKTKELIDEFNNNVVIKSGSSSTSTGSQTAGMMYFYVGKDGTIDFPILGRISVKGRTIYQVASDLENQIRASHIKDAQVTVKIMSFKVTVMGAVKTPGTQEYTGQRLTLLEALGRAGDLNNTAVRKSVLIMREENGVRATYRVDLTDPKSVFESPAYYLQQNDMIYVESNKAEKVKGSTSYTYLTVIGTMVSTVASLAALVVTLTK